MIRLVSKSNYLDANSLLGKFVFRENIFNWPGFSHPRKVVSVSKTRAYVSSLIHSKDQETGFTVLRDERHPESEDGHMQISSIACICDTIDEANHVLKVTEINRRDYDESRKRMEAKLQDLNGVSLQSEAVDSEMRSALTFELTKRGYAVDVDLERFQDLIDSETHVTDFAALDDDHKTLSDKLGRLSGVIDVDYDAHFGNAIYLTIEEDADTAELKEDIRNVIESHLDWCSSLPKRTNGSSLNI